jgi:hypothetical protein
MGEGNVKRALASLEFHQLLVRYAVSMVERIKHTIMSVSGVIGI